ncbi:hypothetical protein DEFDS_0869 [Deferribacter desulfuricans SSM1]|uniref:Uncharacterized protein n=1 Tax=Deferribacter desulfuricans (strain DSM 14783 / JCM 11476 / NBRC 101012 / SSM1) TaxID=639282 RepID=D3PCM2_DEFDS|nr:hypothetical protein [Deferribacter desulfuricans]BAI80345.1 hypothetical protein DEFDS_0869 [Deferribacter desulfuricans SSM1]
MRKDAEQIEVKSYSIEQAQYVTPEKLIFEKAKDGYLHVNRTDDNKFFIYLSDDELNVNYITVPFQIEDMVNLILQAFDEGKKELGTFLLYHLAGLGSVEVEF